MTNDPREQFAIKLMICRAEAIQKYGTLEQALCRLFARLLNTQDELAGIVFFQIIAARSRNKIIEGLLKNRLGDEYSAYWQGIPGSQGIQKQPGLFALIQQLDTDRNFIVHWTVAVNAGAGPVTETLVPPNVWGFIEDKRSISVDDLREFAKKADFVGRSIVSFTLHVFESSRAAAFSNARAWKEIFQQPCVYPPPDNHLLAQK